MLVYAALTDITRMGEWSPENYHAEWNEGFDHAAVGAKFTGHNRHGDKEWTTEAEVVELVPDRRFFFDCDCEGLRLCEVGLCHRGDRSGMPCHRVQPGPQARVGAGAERDDLRRCDRLAHNRTGMEQTLERLAAALEAK